MASSTPSETARDIAINEVKAKRLEISEEGLKGLAAYNYKAGAYTPIDNFLNKHLWVPLSEYIPPWLAPNAITLLGLVIMMTGTVTVSYYSPDLRAPAPTWTYLYGSFTVFAYQTLDALDGKQARKTGSSSPLGQLFDHGCDSASTTLMCLQGATCLHLGYGRGIIFLFACHLPFWLAQWAEYHTHVLATAVGGLVGVTEAQIFFMGFPLVNVVAPGFWEWDLGIELPNQFCGHPECTLRMYDLLLSTQVFMCFVCAGSSFLSVLCTATEKGKAMVQTIPVMLVVLLGLAWASYLPNAHARLVIFSLGSTFTFMTCKMIVAAMSQTSYQAFHTILLPLPVLFVISWLELLPRHEEVLLGAHGAFVAYRTGIYVLNVIEELSVYLGIFPFKLGKRIRTLEDRNGPKVGRTRSEPMTSETANKQD